MEKRIYILIRGNTVWTAHESRRGAEAERRRLVNEGAESLYDMRIEVREIRE